jgi:predicted RNase H-like HicB family nuclease
MRQIVQFQIHRGDTHYVAQAVDFAIVTQAKTLDELVKNIIEATSLHFEGEGFAKFGLSPSPSVLVNFELPQIQYA